MFRPPGRADPLGLLISRIANETEIVSAYITQVPNQPTYFHVSVELPIWRIAFLMYIKMMDYNALIYRSQFKYSLTGCNKEKYSFGVFMILFEWMIISSQKCRHR